MRSSKGCRKLRCREFDARPLANAIRERAERQHANVPAYKREFRHVFLDYRCDGTSYIAPSFGSTDGSAATVNGQHRVLFSNSAPGMNPVLKHKAAAVILADELITRRLTEALALVDIRILDHLVIAGGHALSFAEKGLF